MFISGNRVFILISVATAVPQCSHGSVVMALSNCFKSPWSGLMSYMKELATSQNFKKELATPQNFNRKHSSDQTFLQE